MQKLKFKKYILLIVFFLLPLIFCSALAQALDTQEQAPFTVSAHWLKPSPAQEHEIQARGLPQYHAMVLWLAPQPGYHTYAHHAGEDNMPTQVGVFNATGKAVPVRAFFPAGTMKPDIFDKSRLSPVYAEDTPLFVFFPPGLNTEADFVQVSLLACSDANCTPLTLRVTLQGLQSDTFNPKVFQTFLQSKEGQLLEKEKKSFGLAFGSSNTLASTEQASIANDATTLPDFNFSPQAFLPSLEVSGLGKAMLFGLLAGLLLNVMPCVLPVITMKLSTLMLNGGKLSDAALRKNFRSHNILFAAGIFSWFMALALLCGLAGLAWGQLFQSTAVVWGILHLVFLMALSMFGLFHLPILNFKASGGHGPANAYFSGLFATLLATPCSGPLLGGVLGWSLLQSLPVLITVFAATGFGMALPYVVLALFPTLVHRLPKPGAWMLTLEHFLGFFLMGTCIYLLSILPKTMHIPALSVLLVSAIAAWAWGKWGSFHSRGLKKALVACICLASISLSIWLAFAPEGPKQVHWESYSGAEFQKMLGSEPLLVEFTADWCPTCKVMEKTTLSEDNLKPLVERYNLRLIKVDMTSEDGEKQAFLRALGSASIPLSAIFPKGKLASRSPVLLRDIYSIEQLRSALEQALGENE